MPGIIHNIRIVFGAQTQPSITIQQSDYNSRKIQAVCFTSSGQPMDFSGATVTVVYNAGADPTKEYPVTVVGNVLAFTMPGLAAQTAGSWTMQIFIYGSDSLLHSAEIPYTVRKTITPGTGGDDPVPALVLLIQQTQDAIVECNKATGNANKTVANIEKKLADGDFIGKTGDTGPQGFQGVGVTGASLNGQGELVFTVTDPATGESRTLLPVDIDTSAAINTVEQAAQDGVQKVQDAQASAISAVDQAGKNAGTQAVSEVYSARDTAIADIATVKSGAESAITAAQQSAVQTVQQSGTTAVGQVQKAQNTATTAIAQAQQNAITAVGDEGDAQVQRLQEIVPQPTADNNGMVVAVQSGAYQLENPAGLVLNDGVITSKNGWSSMQIVNTLCPPFTASGATVQCTPVANYPLGVQVEITPTQEGTGDPSPENVRPIVGWDAVTIWRGGNNMLDMDEITVPTDAAYGLEREKIGNYIRIYGTSTETGILSFAIAYSNQNYLYGKGFVFSWFTNGPSVISVYGLRTVSEKSIAIQMELQEDQVYDFTIQIALGVQKLTAYEPYRSQTHTVQLGQTVYGGTLDVGTGAGSEEVRGVQLNGTEGWRQTSNGSFGLLYFEYAFPDSADLLPSSGESIALARLSQKISHFKIGNPYSELVDDAGWVNCTAYLAAAVARIRSSRFENVEDWKSYLAAQYAAGTPVTIAYKLATPTAFQATGAQSIPALPGTNTIYTDAGDITVTGVSDPIATITALQSRVSALESAALN